MTHAGIIEVRDDQSAPASADGLLVPGRAGWKLVITRGPMGAIWLERRGKPTRSVKLVELVRALGRAIPMPKAREGVAE